MLYQLELWARRTETEPRRRCPRPVRCEGGEGVCHWVRFFGQLIVVAKVNSFATAGMGKDGAVPGSFRPSPDGRSNHHAPSVSLLSRH